MVQLFAATLLYSLIVFCVSVIIVSGVSAYRTYKETKRVGGQYNLSADAFMLTFLLPLIVVIVYSYLQLKGM